MQFSTSRMVSCTILGILAPLFVTGCDYSDKHDYTRVHLANGSDATLVFLAIETSESGATEAVNRLSHPLPPTAVYSAVLPRPGNYWIRTETEEGDAVVRRVIGPVRLGRGVYDWEYTPQDEVPLYQSAPYQPHLATVSLPQGSVRRGDPAPR